MRIWKTIEKGSKEKERASRWGNWLRLCVGLTGHGSEKLIGRAGERVRLIIKRRERSEGKGFSSSTIRVVVEKGRDGVRTPLIGSAPAASMNRILILSPCSSPARGIFITLQRWASLKKGATAESPITRENERKQLPSPARKKTMLPNARNYPAKDKHHSEVHLIWRKHERDL